MDEYPLIEVVTLAYDSGKFIDGYFQAFEKLDYPKDRLTINILDNHPDKPDYPVIRKKWIEPGTFPFKIVLEKSDSNLGFTGGNNLIFRRLLKESSAPFYLILNLDTEISRSCVKELVEGMRTDPGAGMVEALQEPKEHPKFYDPFTLETGWCSGGGVLIDSDALRHVGLFDERFFLYCEDVDLSWRMWLHGYRCKVNPRAKYLHFTETLDQEKDLSNQQYFSMRNCFFMHYKYDSLSGIRRLKKDLLAAIEAQPDERSKDTLKRALRDAEKARIKFIGDRIRNFFRPKMRYIVFNGFSFEKRRDFTDMPDGRRVFR